MSVTFYPNYIQYAGFSATAEPSIVGQGYACSGGETTGPAYDLADNRRTNTITIDTNGEATDFTVDFDLTANITNANFGIIDNHNLYTADATVLFEHSGGTDIPCDTYYSGPLGSELTTISKDGSEAAVGEHSTADGILVGNFTSAVTDSAFEVSIKDYEGDSFDADVTMGEIAIGVSFAPAFNPELQPTFGYDLPGSGFNESDGGQRYGFSTHSNPRRAWHFQWKHMSDANKTSLETVFKVTGGVKYPFYIDLGDILGATNPQLYYVRFLKPLSFKGLTKDAWQVDIMIEEEL